MNNRGVGPNVDCTYVGRLGKVKSLPMICLNHDA